MASTHEIQECQAVSNDKSPKKVKIDAEAGKNGQLAEVNDEVVNGTHKIENGEPSKEKSPQKTKVTDDAKVDTIENGEEATTEESAAEENGTAVVENGKADEAVEDVKEIEAVTKTRGSPMKSPLKKPLEQPESDGPEAKKARRSLETDGTEPTDNGDLHSTKEAANGEALSAK